MEEFVVTPAVLARLTKLSEEERLARQKQLEALIEEKKRFLRQQISLDNLGGKSLEFAPFNVYCDPPSSIFLALQHAVPPFHAELAALSRLVPSRISIAFQPAHASSGSSVRFVFTITISSLLAQHPRIWPLLPGRVIYLSRVPGARMEAATAAAGGAPLGAYRWATQRVANFATANRTTSGGFDLKLASFMATDQQTKDAVNVLLLQPRFRDPIGQGGLCAPVLLEFLLEMQRVFGLPDASEWPARKAELMRALDEGDGEGNAQRFRSFARHDQLRNR